MIDNLDDWKASGKFFEHRGHSIFYRDNEKLDKPTLVLIHGFPTASWDWHLLWSPLSESFRLVTLDMIGFGLSAKPTKYDYRIADQADIFTLLLKKLGIEKIHILSHDYGDTVAQELIARDNATQSPTIQSTIMLNGGLFPETHQALLIQKLLMSPIGPLISKLSTYSKFKKNFDHICSIKLSEEELKTLWHLLARDNGSKVIPKQIRYMEERKINRTRWVNAIQQIKTPFRLINGIEDPISGKNMVQRFRELIDSPDIVELDGVGHYPQIEASNRVLEAAQSFWAEHKIISR